MVVVEGRSVRCVEGRSQVTKEKEEEWRGQEMIVDGVVILLRH